MNKLYCFSVLLLCGFLSALNGQAVITGFGNVSDFSPTVTFGTDTPTSSTYSISGSDNGGNLYGSVQSLFIGTPSSLLLTATQSTNLNSSFQIELFDSLGNGALYNGAWSSFTQGVEQSVSLLFFQQDPSNVTTFNGTVASIGLLTAGSGSTLTVVLNTLGVAAIPEPSTYAAIFGAAALGLAVWRKRRKSA